MRNYSKRVFVDKDEENDRYTVYPFTPIHDKIVEFRIKETDNLPSEEALFYEAQYKDTHDARINSMIGIGGLYPFLSGTENYEDTLTAEYIGYRVPNKDYQYYLDNEYYVRTSHEFRECKNPHKYHEELEAFLDDRLCCCNDQPFRVKFPKLFGGKTKNFCMLSTYVGPTWETRPYVVMGGIIQLSDMEYLEQLLRCNKITLLHKRANEEQLNKIFSLFEFDKPIEYGISELKKADKLVGDSTRILYGKEENRFIDGKKQNTSIFQDYREQADIDEPLIEYVKKYVKK